MKKIKPSELGRLKKNPLFDGLSDELKDTKKFKEIDNKIKLLMYSDHKHRKVEAFIKCKRCKDKLHNKQKVIKEYGFKSYQQYLAWSKIMTIITNQKDFQLI